MVAPGAAGKVAKVRFGAMKTQGSTQNLRENEVNGSRDNKRVRDARVLQQRDVGHDHALRVAYRCTPALASDLRASTAVSNVI